MRDSFVFYSSFADSIETAPKEMQLELYKALVECGLERKAITDISFPASMFVTQAMASISNAQKRHEQAVENGGKGGRPRKWVDQEEAEALFAELGTWSAVAEKLDVSENTLLKARRVWEAQKRKNLKNLNVNDNVNGNVNVNDNYQLTNINNKASAGARLEAAPPPQGFEWGGGVFEHGGLHYRMGINKTTGESEVIQLD